MSRASIFSDRVLRRALLVAVSGSFVVACGQPRDASDAPGAGVVDHAASGVADSAASNAPPIATPPSSGVDSAAITPVDVVLAYYADIRAKDYAAAYRRWGKHGGSAGKSESAFTDGFKDTRTVSVTVGDSARIEGAAGSQFATIPVAVDAELSSGTRQHFVGTYTLRRVMVDGAPPEDRRWHIESADLKPR